MKSPLSFLCLPLLVASQLFVACSSDSPDPDGPGSPNEPDDNKPDPKDPKPGEPGEPNEPGEPGEPNEPGEPGEPGEPNEPEEPPPPVRDPADFCELVDILEYYGCSTCHQEGSGEAVDSIFFPLTREVLAPFQGRGTVFTYVISGQMPPAGSGYDAVLEEDARVIQDWIQRGIADGPDTCE